MIIIAITYIKINVNLSEYKSIILNIKCLIETSLSFSCLRLRISSEITSGLLLILT